MLRLTIVFVLSAVSLINAVPTLAPEEPYKYVFHYGSLDSITYDVSKGHQILLHPNFDKSKPTVLYINGWAEDESVAAIVRAYLKRGDHNVIVLDWQQDNSGSYISEGIRTMKEAANAVGNSLVRMIDSGLSVDRLHLVGFSLGAHLAGYIGRQVKQAGQVNLRRISGLDPSLAGFYIGHYQQNTAINANDADFVDIIHTDSWLNGAPSHTGTVDFWPNGGKSVQPGCPLRTSEEYDVEESCSHTRAWVYWAESVANRNVVKRFYAAKAKNWRLFQMAKTVDVDANTVMGIDTPAGVTGDYYLQTNSALPFSRGRDGVEYSRAISTNLI